MTLVRQQIRFRQLTRSFVAVALIGWTQLAAGTANAEFQLQFGQAGMVGVTSFSANAGESLDFEIYLTQSNGESRLSTDGLSGFQFNLNLSGDGSVFIPDPVPFVPATGLDSGAFAISNLATSATYAGGAPADPMDPFLTQPAFPPMGSDSILLGQTTIHSSLLASGSYDFTVSIVDSFSFILGNDVFFGELIEPLPGMAQLNVAAIPEPSSLLALATTGIATTMLRRRRATKSQAQAS